MLRRSSLIAHRTAIGLTFKTGTAGGRRAGGDHGAIVFLGLVVLCGLLCWEGFAVGFFVTL